MMLTVFKRLTNSLPMVSGKQEEGILLELYIMLPHYSIKTRIGTLMKLLNSKINIK